MSDFPVYAVVNPARHRRRRLPSVEKGFFPLLKKHGGEFVNYDNKAFTLEGTSPRTGRMIILEFPSEAQASAWYADPEPGAFRASPRRHAAGVPDEGAKHSATLSLLSLIACRNGRLRRSFASTPALRSTMSGGTCTREVSPSGALQMQAIAVYGKRSTGAKVPINPNE